MATNSGDFVANNDGTVTLNTVAAGANNPTAKLTGVFDTGSSYPKSATAVFRVKPLAAAATYNQLDFEIGLWDTTAAVGSRIKMGVGKSGSGIVMELDGTAKPFVKNSTPNNSPDGLAKVDLTLEHTYQLVVTLATANTGNVKVYVDGAAAAVLDLTLNGSGTNVDNASGLPTTYGSVFRQQATVGDNYILFGDGSGSNVYQSMIDWVVWVPGAAYTPAQISGKFPASIGAGTY